MECYINLVASYHSNDAIILAAFPKDLVDEDCHIIDHNRINELYIINDYSHIIKPEYLMGTIIKNDNGFDEFYTRYEIIERNLSRHI